VPLGECSAKGFCAPNDGRVLGVPLIQPYDPFTGRSRGLKNPDKNGQLDRQQSFLFLDRFLWAPRSLMRRDRVGTGHKYGGGAREN
jgi:hypothetical protein